MIRMMGDDRRMDIDRKMRIIEYNRIMKNMVGR